MERSGAGTSGARDLHDLAELVQCRSPFLTIWAGRDEPLGVPASLESDAHAAAGSSLPGDAVDALVAAASDALVGSAGVVGVADHRGVRLVELLPDVPRARLVRLETLPSLAPVIEHRQADVPFIVVVIDRRGADLMWSDGHRRTAGVVPAVDGPETKSAPGGWSQKRYQQRAENAWEHTAAAVADDLTQLARRIEPGVITVAGDIRISHMLRDHLAPEIAELVREVPGSRSADGSEERREEAIERWVRTAAAEQLVAILRLFEQERGQQDRACDGATATFEALREARVDVLLVHDDPDDLRRAWFVPESPALVSDDPEQLVALGHPTPEAGRLTDVAIRAALLTSADVRIVPGAGPVPEGIGAVLRW